MTKEESQVEQFNKNIKVGATIKIEKDNGAIEEHEVTAPASLLGGHTPVVWLKGVAGCYALDRVRTKYY